MSWELIGAKCTREQKEKAQTLARVLTGGNVSSLILGSIQAFAKAALEEAKEEEDKAGRLVGVLEESVGGDSDILLDAQERLNQAKERVRQLKEAISE